MTQYDTTQHSMIWHNMTQHNIVWFDTNEISKFDQKWWKSGPKISVGNSDKSETPEERFQYCWVFCIPVHQCDKKILLCSFVLCHLLDTCIRSCHIDLIWHNIFEQSSPAFYDQKLHYTNGFFSTRKQGGFHGKIQALTMTKSRGD